MLSAASLTFTGQSPGEEETENRLATECAHRYMILLSWGAREVGVGVNRTSGAMTGVDADCGVHSGDRSEVKPVRMEPQ